MYCLKNVLFFGIALLHYHINLLDHQKFSVFFSGEVYLSLDNSISNPIFFASLSTLSERFCGEALEAFVMILTILFPIKSQLLQLFYEMLFSKQFYVRLQQIA